MKEREVYDEYDPYNGDPRHAAVSKDEREYMEEAFGFGLRRDEYHCGRGVGEEEGSNGR